MKNEEKRVWIEWTNKKMIREQFKTIEEFMLTNYAECHASNFGMEHRVKSTMGSWSKYEIINIFITEENKKLNYGLDFNIWIHYKTSEGMIFLKQISFGGGSITSAPLMRVNFSHKYPEGLDFDNIENNTKELIKEWSNNLTNGIFESFEFSGNVGWKKDREYRAELIETCKKYNHTYA
jgi:hypothetical protein